MAEPSDPCPLLQMRPIGHMESCFKYKNGTPRQSGVVSAARGTLTIDRSLYSNPEHSLEGLEEFSHVWILFLFHKNNNAYKKAKVKPPRLNGQKVGVFSTRSPYRPNAVGLTLAKIECIQGASVQLSGIDLLDGTPVLDLKPYIATYDQPCLGEDVDRVLDDDTTSPRASHAVNCDRQESRNSSLDGDDGLERRLSSNVENVCDDGESSATTPCDIVRAGTHSSETGAGCDAMNCDGNVKNNKSTMDVSQRSDSSVSGKSLESHASAATSEVILEPHGGERTSQVAGSGGTTVNASSPEMAAQDSLSRVPPEEKSSSASWIKQPPIAQLTVEFTERAQQQIMEFSTSAADPLYRLKFLNSSTALEKSICDILKADPRSTYRRTKCMDRLYFFIVDNCHVTCWFDSNRAEVVRVQPAAFGHPEQGIKRAALQSQ